LNIEAYKEVFLAHLSTKVQVKEPKNLYEPILYILNLGGKRIRPVLMLMSCDLFGGNFKDALDASLAIEMFHNFSLVHDDIMDHAPLRRGKLTVHEKWGLNTGILSGDAMLVLANQLFESYDAETYKRLMKLFNETALMVCEGQQLDIDFESRNDVTLEDYIKMTSYKTAVLLAASLKMGAIVAEACEDDAQKIYNYGLNLGIAFQLQDDYLDVFAEEDFGKQKAGDIIENKKTWMYLKALSLSDENDKNSLLSLYANKSENKVIKVTRLFEKYNIPQLIKLEIDNYTNKSFKNSNDLSINEIGKKMLLDFSFNLMQRKI
jgi:geranylgeranyl diphosphate synthase type II